MSEPLLLSAPRPPDDLERMMRLAAHTTHREAAHRCPQLLVRGKPLTVRNQTGADMPCPGCRQVVLIHEEGPHDQTNNLRASGQE